MNNQYTGGGNRAVLCKPVSVEIIYVGDVPYVEWSLETYGTSPEPPRRPPVLRRVHRGPTKPNPEDLDPYPPDRVEGLFRVTLDEKVAEIMEIIEDEDLDEELIPLFSGAETERFAEFLFTRQKRHQRAVDVETYSAWHQLPPEGSFTTAKTLRPL
jgi:hypothetical protein